jgi:hypothetical protein
MLRNLRKTGRPSIFTKEVLQKLEYAFSIGCSDREACLYADIASSTLYKYCQDNEEFSERKELLKDKPVLAARMAVVKAIEAGDTKMAWNYLERKRSEEFGRYSRPASSDEKVLTLDDLEAMAQGDVIEMGDDELRIIE